MFLHRHPKVSLKTPQALQICRASSCTTEVMDKWYSDYEQFLLIHELYDKPDQIWNADESGFFLCPKSGKILGPKGEKHVYHVTGSSKQQITTLVCINAAGSSIPPMHIFPGIRFSYNPMEGCVDGAYFGKSDSGWITQELFYGWLTNHFVRYITPSRPVCLLVDGHSSHIDLETSKFCEANDILLYCLPPHSSHITQPLDVGFFSSLKHSWQIAVSEFQSGNGGVSVNKQSFSKVFKKAYTNTLKCSMIINPFKRSGIYPPNRLAINEKKLGPSKLYKSTKETSEQQSQPVMVKLGLEGKKLALKALEEEMGSEMIAKYEQRLEECYDLDNNPVYNTWKKLKQQRRRKAPQNIQAPHKLNPILEDILKLP